MAESKFSEAWGAISHLAPLKKSIQDIANDPEKFREALATLSYEEFNNMQKAKLSEDHYEIITKLINELTDINQAEHCLKCIEIYETYSGPTAQCN